MMIRCAQKSRSGFFYIKYAFYGILLLCWGGHTLNVRAESAVSVTQQGQKTPHTPSAQTNVVNVKPLVDLSNLSNLTAALPLQRSVPIPADPHTQKISKPQESRETISVIHEKTVPSPLPSVGKRLTGKKTMVIERNMAEYVEFEDQVAEVFVANPEIVDVQVDGTTGGYIFARKLGSTTIIIRSTTGQILSQINVRVTHNLGELRDMIRRSFPGENIKVDSTPTGLFLSGTVASSVMAKDVENMAGGFLVEKERVTNGMTVSSPTQILLKVTIAEVNRAALNQFGINWSAIANSPHFIYGILMGRTPISDGSVAGIPAGAFIPGGVSASGEPPLNSYGFQYRDQNTTLSGLLDALDAEDLVTVLAKPNLMAVSGETASFLVGGEFPYPVPQNNSVSVQFKEYGIRLAFTPTVLDQSTISLKVAPEVSELDDTNRLQITVFGGTSTTVPAIKSRKTETTIRLGDGQSLALAGLLSSASSNHYDDIPGLADIPILGALFRSTKFKKRETELVIIVTAHLVDPVSDKKELGLPTDNLKRASNLDMLVLQRLNRVNRNKSPSDSLTDGQLSGDVMSK